MRADGTPFTESPTAAVYLWPAAVVLGVCGVIWIALRLAAYLDEEDDY